MKLTLMLAALLVGLMLLCSAAALPAELEAADDLEGADLQGDETFLLKWLLKGPHYYGGYHRPSYYAPRYAPRYHAPKYYKSYFW